MANVTETESYDAGVYRLETTDPVVGGETGTSNKPIKNLANRTKWLKARVDELLTTISSGSLASGTEVVGDVLSEKTVIINIGKALASTNYMVFGSIVGLGVPLADANVQWIVIGRTTTTFTIYLREFDQQQAHNMNFEWELRAK